ncbi:MAG: AAA family ATPase [archaeon]|nr:AAA family ATPase [archaeon]
MKKLIPLEERKQLRVPTGIKGMDELIEGGFYRGDIILLCGEAGSGKTTFCAQFVYNGANLYGEKAIYVSLEEGADRLTRNMQKYGFDFERLKREHIIELLDVEVSVGEGLKSQIDYILYRADMIHANRLVIDSLSSLLLAQDKRIEARALLHSLYDLFKRKDLTTLMTISIPRGSKSIGLGFEEAMVDGVILLESMVEQKVLENRLLILKMRGTNHSKEYQRVIFSDKGLTLTPCVK